MRTFAEGMYLSLPICLLIVANLEGGNLFGIHIYWYAIVIGFPWNIPALAFITIAILGSAATRLLLATVGIWMVLSIHFNCIFLMKLIKISRIGGAPTKPEEVDGSGT